MSDLLPLTWDQAQPDSVLIPQFFQDYEQLRTQLVRAQAALSQQVAPTTNSELLIAECAQWQARAEAAESRSEATHSELQSLREAVALDRQELEKQRKSAKSLNKTIASLQSQLVDSKARQSQIMELEKALKKAQAERDQLRKDETRIKAEHSIAMKELQTAQTTSTSVDHPDQSKQLQAQLGPLQEALKKCQIEKKVLADKNLGLTRHIEKLESKLLG
jgi:chromosome segregation ATPase